MRPRSADRGAPAGCAGDARGSEHARACDWASHVETYYILIIECCVINGYPVQQHRETTGVLHWPAGTPQDATPQETPACHAPKSHAPHVSPRLKLLARRKTGPDHTTVPSGSELRRMSTTRSLVIPKMAPFFFRRTKASPCGRRGVASGCRDAFEGRTRPGRGVAAGWQPRAGRPVTSGPSRREPGRCGTHCTPARSCCLRCCAALPHHTAGRHCSHACLPLRAPPPSLAWRPASQCPVP